MKKLSTFILVFISSISFYLFQSIAVDSYNYNVRFSTTLTSGVESFYVLFGQAIPEVTPDLNTEKQKEEAIKVKYLKNKSFDFLLYFGILVFYSITLIIAFIIRHFLKI